MISENDWQGDRPWAGPKAIRYQPQAMSSSIVILASSNAQRHGNVMTALRACTGGSKWSVVFEKPANIGTAQVFHLNELQDVRIFLLHQMRIFQNRDVETPAKGFFTRANLAQAWKISEQQANRKLKKYVASGLMETKYYRVKSGQVTRPIPHYRIKE